MQKNTIKKLLWAALGIMLSVALANAQVNYQNIRANIAVDSTIWVKGRLGIGTNTPNYKLHCVGGDAMFTNSIAIGTGSAPGARLDIWAGSSLSTSITSRAAGPVGNIYDFRANSGYLIGGTYNTGGGGALQLYSGLYPGQTESYIFANLKLRIATQSDFEINNYAAGSFIRHRIGTGGSNIVSTMYAGGTVFGQGALTNSSVLLEVQSTTQGFLPPRMTTTQRNAISGPATGLIIYNTTTNKLNLYNGSAWREVEDL